MDCTKVGNLIRTLRQEKQLTQKQLADILYVSDKAVSKWECGQGCPDVSLLPQLAEALAVPIEQLLQGDIAPSELVGGNMKHLKYYVCPSCGGFSLCSGQMGISCCGRSLEALAPQKATQAEKLTVEQIEDDWYITSAHPMAKENYISFLAFATGDRVEVRKQYPEWNLQTRMPRRGHGMLLWYSTTKGLFYQLL